VSSHALLAARFSYWQTAPLRRPYASPGAFVENWIAPTAGVPSTVTQN
jgi:hypothetical protein